MIELLKDKNVLFIGPNMFDYPTSITNQLKELGASVLYLPDYPQRLSARIIRNMSPLIYQKIVNRYLQSILKRIKGKRIDYFFVIGRAIITPKFLQTFRQEHPEAYLITYQWDSNKLYPYFNLLSWFDKAFSFDPQDCKENGILTYLPLFYQAKYKCLRYSQCTKDIQLLHIGSLHPSRYASILKMEKFCKEHQLRFEYYLYMPFSSYVKFLMKGKNYRKAKFRKLNQQEILTYYDRSTAILDLPQEGQSGFTMRTFEVLGAGKKLVTTHPGIKSADFFSSNMITHCDFSNDIPFSKDFLSEKLVITRELEDSLEKYSLKEWLNTIFQTTE